MRISKADLARHDADFICIIRKVATGTTLTAEERAILDEKADAKSKDFGATWDDLAGHLDVTRRQIQRWRRSKRLLPFIPPDELDGRKSVRKWEAFKQRLAKLKTKDRKKRAENAARAR